MIPDSNPRIAWFSVRDHGTPSQGAGRSGQNGMNDEQPQKWAGGADKPVLGQLLNGEE
jgi:hypothetical protein